MTLAVEATRGQTVGSVIPLLSRVSLNVFQPEPDSIASLEVGSSFPLRPGRSHELLILLKKLRGLCENGFLFLSREPRKNRGGVTRE